MKLKILGKGKYKLRLEVKGEGHTLLNLLRDELLQIRGVEFAGYRKEHPSKEKAELIVRAKSKPQSKVKTALKRIREKAEEFGKLAEKLK